MRSDQLTILVVEDKPTDVILLQRAFEKSRLANPLRFLSDGESAVEYLAGQGEHADRQRSPLPILILLDLKLPRRSGLEVLEWLRAQETLKRIPVVMLTSSAQDRDVNAAYDLGVNSYLIKPVDFDDLLRMLQAVNMYWLMLNERPRLDGR